MSTVPENIELYNTILESLERKFGIAILISRPQFRELVQLSMSTDNRMYNSKEYPKTIKVRGEERILIADLAEFLSSRPSGRELNRPKPYTKNPKLQKSVSVA